MRKHSFLRKSSMEMRKSARATLSTEAFLSDFTEILEFPDQAEMLATASETTDWFGTSVMVFSSAELFRICQEDMKLGRGKIHRILIDEEITPPDHFITSCLGEADVLLFMECKPQVISKTKALCRGFRGHTVLILTTEWTDGNA